MNSNRDLLQALCILVISLMICQAIMIFDVHNLKKDVQEGINKNTHLIQCLTEAEDATSEKDC